MRFEMICPCGDYKISGSKRENGAELMEMHMRKCVLSEKGDVQNG